MPARFRAAEGARPAVGRPAPAKRARPATFLLAAVLVGAVGCGDPHAPTNAGGVVVAAGPASAQTVTVHGNDRDQFSPQTVQARVGRLTITLQNGGVPHNLTFQDGALPGISTVGGGETKSTTLTFAHSGSYVFVCTIHPGMTGKLVVTS